MNYGTSTLTWGWRLSLGLAIVPAIILTLGGIFLPESPNSLVERGRRKEGRAILERVRGTSQVDAGERDTCLWCPLSLWCLFCQQGGERRGAGGVGWGKWGAK